jgi:hypothetical protein
MADQFIEVDNIFPEFSNIEVCSIQKFAQKIKDLEEGDIIEFGVASATTTIEVAKNNPDRKLFAFDHFLGLEVSEKPVPNHSGWSEGAFRVGDPDYPHIPDTIEGVFKKLEKYPNVKLFVEDVHELKEPSDYGIGKIVAVNVDVDIYEPTVSSLKFLDKCEWDKLYIRFDDWHGHDPQFDHHERLAAREWLDRTGYKFDVPENGHVGGMIVWR